VAALVRTKNSHRKQMKRLLQRNYNEIKIRVRVWQGLVGHKIQFDMQARFVTASYFSN
jgi:hypothetical protein